MRLPGFWRRHFLEVETIAAVLPSVGLAVWLVFFEGMPVVNDLISGNRTNIYRTSATIAGTLLGFSITVASLVLNFASSPRLAVVRRSRHYPKLWKTFFQTIRYLGGLTIIALVCLVWDKDKEPFTWLIIPFFLFLNLSIVRLIRVIWILEQIIGIVSRPSPAGDRMTTQDAYE